MLPNILAKWQRFLIMSVVAVLTIACLYAAKAILIPFILAVLFTFILNPLVSIMERMKLGRIVSVLLATGCTFSFLGLLGWIFTQQMGELARELPKHKENVVQKVAALKGNGELFASLISFGQDVVDEVGKESTPRTSATKSQPMKVIVEESSVPQNLGWATTILGPFLDNLLGAVFIVALVILMLIHRENLRNRIIRLAGQGQLICTTRVLDDVVHRISSFLVMQVVINLSFGVVLGLGLFLIGVPYSPFFALLSGLLRFVPYIGTAAAAAILIVVDFAFFPGWTECLLTMGLFTLLELSTGYVIEPLLFGHHTGTSPVALLMAAAFWSWLWGPIGLILSTPMTVCLIVLGKYVPNLSLLNILLGDEPVLTEQFRYYQRLLARDQDEAVEILKSYLQSHSGESVYDEILVPALVLAKRDLAVGGLSEEHANWIHQIIRETIEEYVSLRQEHVGASDKSPESATFVLGCAAHDDADELALHMLANLLQIRSQELILISSRTLTSEILAAVEKENPRAVIIGALPSGGLTRSYFLCKKLRSKFPKMQIFLGRWGLTERVEQTRERALAEGATELHTRLSETADVIQPIPPAIQMKEQRELVSA